MKGGTIVRRVWLTLVVAGALSAWWHGAWCDDVSLLQVASYEVKTNCFNLARDGTTLYLAGTASGLLVFEVSNPEKPALLSTIPGPNGAEPVADVVIRDQKAYLACGSYKGTVRTAGFRIVDVKDPARPVPMGEIVWRDAGDVAIALDVENNRAYVCQRTNDAEINGGRLRVVDVSDPRSPREVGVFDSPRGPKEAPQLWSHDNRNIRLWGVDVVGNIAYTCWDGDGGSFRAIDISDPANPRELGGYKASIRFNRNATNHCVVVKDKAYLALDMLFMAVVDVSDASNIRELGALNPFPDYEWKQYGGHGIRITAVPEKNLLFLAAGTAGVAVIDISNPHHPILAGKRESKGYECWSVLVDGDYVYTGVFRNETVPWSGLEIFRWKMHKDVTVPMHIKDFIASDIEDGSTHLSWTNPDNSWDEPGDWCKTVVVRNQNRCPVRPDDGVVVYEGPASSYVDAVPRPGVSYFYTAFSCDEASNYSSAVSCAQGVAQAASQIPTVKDILRSQKGKMPPERFDKILKDYGLTESDLE